MDISFQFSDRLWLYHGDKSSWFFVTIPKEEAAGIRFFTQSEGPHARRGFGAVRVLVRIGKTSWRTSIFPDKARDSYILPVKKDVRDAENLEKGDEVTISLSVL